MAPDGVFDRRPTGMLLRFAHHHARAAANEALRPLDLDLRHVGVLAVLSEHGPQTQRQLIDAVELDKSSMVYVIDKLERQGLVSRERTPADRRAYAVTVSDHGRGQLKKAISIATEVMDELLESFTADDVRQLNDMLRRIISNSRERRQRLADGERPT
ncbi:MAG: MarR family transcriptional regulator [Kutzneria sp.]|nr:MarR family transcriptional regulator [Kutzneria sp.]MBV9845193.1 MarR family transcriptional regulator [Kutzneria sp.]